MQPEVAYCLITLLSGQEAENGIGRKQSIKYVLDGRRSNRHKTYHEGRTVVKKSATSEQPCQDNQRESDPK